MQTSSPPARGVFIGRSGKADRSAISTPPRTTPKAPHPIWMGVNGQIVFNELIRFDQAAIPVMISQ
jgi:hypothetical protein